MMALGLFVFELRSAPFQEMQHKKAWRHPSGSAVGVRPESQFLGLDEETVTLSGVLYPELTGGELTLLQLDEMADQGTSWPLIGGDGYLYGLFVIESKEVTRSVFFSDGAARQIDFTLNLKRVDDNAVDTLGGLLGNLGGLASLGLGS
ncbi:phage tail protein [Chitinimonas sp. BJB300]|uniref:phage tail protein n=1 Tax=Chitinimonas sp. BJB300 TaxID=1559339 RepID=UPI001E4C9CE5|nr:phage tail protein [Chitinimonas sp. BJB300]